MPDGMPVAPTPDDRSAIAATPPPAPDPEERAPRRRRILRIVAVVLGVLVLAPFVLAGYLLLKPVDLPVVPPTTDPAASYEAAMARFDGVDEREAGRDLIPECHSKLLTPGAPTDRVIVLFHGYTNCPAMFEKLGEQLAAEGFTVYIPLAPEHGETDREHSTLADLTTAELMAYGDEAVDIAAGLGDSVTVVGLSGGGTVAAYLGQYRDDVELAVVMAPFIGLLQVPADLTTALVNLADLLPPLAWGIPESMASGSGQYAPYAGLDQNTRSAAAYMRLGELVLTDAADQPHRAGRTVVVTNEADDTVNNDLAERLLARWSELASGTATEYRFEASLGLPHDLIGPDRVDQRTDIVYPVLLDLIGPA